MMIRFLNLAEVLLIYENQIRNYGGLYGVRDLGLLSSALYMPQASFEGSFLHDSIPKMAAAYAFHVCQNHAVVDGNKRLALAAALVFLDLNNYELFCDEDELYETMMSVAKHEISKETLSQWFESYCKKITD